MSKKAPEPCTRKTLYTIHQDAHFNIYCWPRANGHILCYQIFDGSLFTVNSLSCYFFLLLHFILYLSSGKQKAPPAIYIQFNDDSNQNVNILNCFKNFFFVTPNSNFQVAVSVFLNDQFLLSFCLVFSANTKRTLPKCVRQAICKVFIQFYGNKWLESSVGLNFYSHNCHIDFFSK